MQALVTATALAVVLRTHAGTNGTGAILVSDSDQTCSGRVFLREGSVYAVHVDGYVPNLMRRFQAAGILNREGYNQALKYMNGDERDPGAADVCLRLGLVDRKAVDAVNRELALASLAAMACWDDIKTNFRKGATTNVYAVPPVAVDSLLLALDKRAERWSSVAAILTPERAKVGEVIPCRSGSSGDVPPDMQSILAAANGARTLDEIAGGCGMSRFEAGYLVQLLVQHELLTVTSVDRSSEQTASSARVSAAAASHEDAPSVVNSQAGLSTRANLGVETKTSATKPTTMEPPAENKAPMYRPGGPTPVPAPVLVPVSVSVSVPVPVPVPVSSLAKPEGKTVYRPSSPPILGLSGRPITRLGQHVGLDDGSFFSDDIRRKVEAESLEHARKMQEAVARKKQASDDKRKQEAAVVAAEERKRNALTDAEFQRRDTAARNRAAQKKADAKESAEQAEQGRETARLTVERANQAAEQAEAVLAAEQAEVQRAESEADQAQRDKNSIKQASMLAETAARENADRVAAEVKDQARLAAESAASAEQEAVVAAKSEAVRVKVATQQAQLAASVAQKARKRAGSATVALTAAHAAAAAAQVALSAAEHAVGESLAALTRATEAVLDDNTDDANTDSVEETTPIGNSKAAKSKPGTAKPVVE